MGISAYRSGESAIASGTEIRGLFSDATVRRFNG
jgi:hypothetical protein